MAEPAPGGPDAPAQSSLASLLVGKHHANESNGWERVGDRKNALNLIRFVLATLVLVDHSFPITGHAPLEIAGMGLGTWCVAGFFCLSGYLIAGSRTRTSAAAYLWRRCLRIFPGLVVALVLTAIIAAPIAATASGAGAWEPGSALRYVVRNILLYNPPFGIGETLHAAPYPDAWNGSLWTLFYEFVAYLVIGLLLTPAVVRRHAMPMLAALFVLAVAAGPLVSDRVSTNLFKHAIFLGTFFLAGALMWALRTRVPLTAPLGMAAAVLLVVMACIQPTGSAWASLPLAYVLLWLGSALPLHTFSTHDISYGMYIYAFPIQQLITVTTGNRNPYVLMATATACTAALAYASWRLVESPALQLKRYVR